MNENITFSPRGSVFTKYVLRTYLYQNKINCVKNEDSRVPPQSPKSEFQEDEQYSLIKGSHHLQHSATGSVLSREPDVSSAAHDLYLHSKPLS